VGWGGTRDRAHTHRLASWAVEGIASKETSRHARSHRRAALYNSAVGNTDTVTTCWHHGTTVAGTSSGASQHIVALLRARSDCETEKEKTYVANCHAHTLALQLSATHNARTKNKQNAHKQRAHEASHRHGRGCQGVDAECGETK
jgi:hypothetical protein